eukprot:gene25692-34266_t
MISERSTNVSGMERLCDILMIKRAANEKALGGPSFPEVSATQQFLAAVALVPAIALRPPGGRHINDFLNYYLGGSSMHTYLWHPKRRYDNRFRSIPSNSAFLLDSQFREDFLSPLKEAALSEKKKLFGGTPIDLDLNQRPCIVFKFDRPAFKSRNEDEIGILSDFWAKFRGLEIGLEFERKEDLYDDLWDLEQCVPYELVPASQSFSYRSVLSCLQKMTVIPLEEEIVDGTSTNGRPEYIPDIGLTSLDQSQRDALRLALTTRVAIIQGPPGTGKTIMGSLIVRTILVSKSPNTNHAEVRDHSERGIAKDLQFIDHSELEDGSAHLDGQIQNKHLRDGILTAGYPAENALRVGRCEYDGVGELLKADMKMDEPGADMDVILVMRTEENYTHRTNRSRQRLRRQEDTCEMEMKKKEEEGRRLITIRERSRHRADGAIGFLKERQRVNVMLSRARIGMYIVGNSETLCSSRTAGGSLWVTLTDYLSFLMKGQSR